KLVDPKNLELLQDYGGPDKILDGLETNRDHGLSSDEDKEKRQKHFGKNVLPKVDQQSFLFLVWDAFCDKTLNLSNQSDEPDLGWIEGTAILAAVVVVVLTNAINNYQKERQFRKLNEKKEDRNIKLIRDGKERQISVFDVYVGDIMVLEPGDIVAVDGIYLSGHNLTCDESSATGESKAIKKGDKDPFILSGAKVTEGVGRVVVIAVGEHSYFGKTMM
ncbi:8792_t:CDS:2, partial [Racocetra persica]